jgi:hypothetical protein
VLDHRRACRTPRQPDGKILAQPEHRIVPAFANRYQREVCEIRMLFAKQRLNKRRVD